MVLQRSVRTLGVALIFPLLIGCAPSIEEPSPVAATSLPEAAPASTEETWDPPQHRIAIRIVDENAEFFDKQTGEAFIPRGVNYVYLPQPDGSITNLPLKEGIYDPLRTRTDFAAIASEGFNTVRVFFDHCNVGPGCIGDADNDGLNAGYLANIADMMAAAKETGIFLLLTSNDLPDQGGYAEEANQLQGETFAGYRNSYYLTPNAVNATRRYWGDVLAGLIDQQAAFDAVLGWQLLNEQWMFADEPPLSLELGLVETTTGVYDMGDPLQKTAMVSDGLIYYIAEMKSEILRHDPTALVTMGFFAPGAAPGWYVETASLLEGAALDFFDFHAYPGDSTLEAYAQSFGMPGYKDKPIILGEYGPFRHVYGDLIPAARAVTEWVVESCLAGFNGWLYWAYYPAGPSVNDRTWGFTDADGFLMDLLSPSMHPDPCAPIAISSGNLAYAQPVRASRSLPGEGPELAVDETDSTQWGSGGDAPQWIEVQLAQPGRVGEIRLLVAQYPPGETAHQVQIRRAGSELFEVVYEFRQPTQEGDWLVFRPEGGLEGVQAIRIQTLSSPSWVAWKEIQVFEEARSP